MFSESHARQFISVILRLLVVEGQLSGLPFGRDRSRFHSGLGMHRDPPLFDRETAKKSGRRSSWQFDPSESVLVLIIITDNPCSVNLEPWLITVRKYSGNGWENVPELIIASQKKKKEQAHNEPCISDLNKAQLCRRFRQLSSKTQPPSIQ